MSLRPYRSIEPSVTPQYGLVGVAAANSVAVASLYWNQALAKAIASDFPHDLACLTLVPGVTLAGYATGVAALAFGISRNGPFALEFHMGLLAAGLAVAGLAPTASTLAVASFLVGCGAAVAQRLLAAAARCGRMTGAGNAIGRVICAALISVLCVRLTGEFAAEVFGWRNVFFATAASVAALGFINHSSGIDCGSPRRPGPNELTSLISLWQFSNVLRKAAFQQGAVFLAYSSAWMLLLLHASVEQRYLVITGAGGVGVAAALLAGRVVDNFAHRNWADVGTLAVLVAAVLLLPAAYNLVPGLAQVLLLVVGMALLDAGLQVALVTNQTRVQALAPVFRARLAALLTVCGSLGSALGAGVTYWLWQQCS